MSLVEAVEKIYKSYVAKWTAILFIVGVIVTTTTWISGGLDWIDGKVNTYIEVQKAGVIDNASGLIKQAIIAEKAYYDTLIKKKLADQERLELELEEHHSMVKMLTDAMLGELDRSDHIAFSIWSSNTGKNYYERGGKIYAAWFESNRQRWMYRDYQGVTHKCN